MKLAAALFLLAAANAIAAQGPCGGKPCPVIVVRTPPNSAPSGSTGTRRGPARPAPPRRPSGSSTVRTPGNGTTPPTPKPEPLPCEDADLVVVCGMSGCEINLNNLEKHVTDELGGFTFKVQANQTYRIRVTKPGYDPFEKTETRLECGDQREVNAVLVARPVTLRIRTIPAECDIYLDNQKQPKGSDGAGLFSYLLTKPNLLLEARKPRYLSKTKSIILKPELANTEIVLELEPYPATLRVAVNTSNVQLTLDGKAPEPLAERLSLPPGPHTLVFAALGYARVTMQLTAAPDETIDRDVHLERLPVAELQTEAERLLTKRAFDDVLKLSRYILETDGANGAAHRLQGYVYLARGDYGQAGTQFSEALAVNEPVTLRIRRHIGEKFELSKGHDLCEGRLVLRKSEVEFQGLRNAAENFKVPYEQAQVIGVQLKSSVAAYLATKVTANGKRHDYNFYSFDKELSSTDKPYLEMIQRLLRAH
jgi:hypothetical protein